MPCMVDPMTSNGIGDVPNKGAISEKLSVSSGGTEMETSTAPKNWSLRTPSNMRSPDTFLYISAKSEVGAIEETLEALCLS